MNWVRAGTSSSLQYLICLKSKTVKIYLVVESVKLLLVLSIYSNLNERLVESINIFNLKEI